MATISIVRMLRLPLAGESGAQSCAIAFAVNYG
jgi:hypothetical protein